MKRTRFKKKEDVKSEKVKEKYNQLIAVNLKDKMKDFAQYPPPIPGFSISRLEYLVHLILSHKQDKHRGAYSILNMEYMNNIVPGAGKYMQFLKNQGIIEWVNYSAGRNSRLYRLVNEGRTEYRAISDKALIRRIEKNSYKIKLQNSKMFPALNRWIKSVEINIPAALETIEKDYINSKDTDTSAEARRNYSLGAVCRIEAKDIYFHVNTTNYRLDSNYTNLPGTLMKHISINGEYAYEMDVSNSQPFFLATLMDMTPEVEEVCSSYLGNSLTMYIKSMNIAVYEDVKRYVLLVTTGKFYEFMAEKFKEYGIDFTDRKDLKQQLFVVFFGKTNAHKFSPAARVFRSEFPHVQRLINVVKKRGYNNLAILLQRIESYVMIKRVATNITIELPRLPILTKHDSILPFRIMVYGKEINEARLIMVHTIQEVTGLKPQGRMKRYVN